MSTRGVSAIDPTPSEDGVSSAGSREAGGRSRATRGLGAYRHRLRLLSALAFAAAALAVLLAADRVLPDPRALGSLGTSAPLSVALFVALGAVLTAFGVSRQGVALLGGYLHGATLGTALALAATLGGCALAYQTAASLGARSLGRRFPHLLAHVGRWTREDVFAASVAARLFPLGSNLAVNLAAGISRAPRGPFLAGSAVGYLPQTLLFALAGAGVAGIDPGAHATALALVSLAFALAIGAGLALAAARRRRRRGRTTTTPTGTRAAR